MGVDIQLDPERLQEAGVVKDNGIERLVRSIRRCREIIDLVTLMVAPNTWTDNGGSGSISMYRGLLVVSQTDDVHSEVDLLLRQLGAGEKSQPGDVIQFTV